MAILNTNVRAIDLFYEAKNGEGPAPEGWTDEACYLFEWLGEDESRCKALDDFITVTFPNGTDMDEYAGFFRDNWQEIAEACGCPEHYLANGY